jgi:hypothetical protein
MLLHVRRDRPDKALAVMVGHGAGSYLLEDAPIDAQAVGVVARTERQPVRSTLADMGSGCPVDIARAPYQISQRPDLGVQVGALGVAARDHRPCEAADGEAEAGW